MNRKLLVLNLVLVAAVGYAGLRIRAEWRAAKARQAATLNRKVAPAAPPPFTRLSTPPPVLPSGYIDIAQKMLFDKSRNSVVELPPPPAPPPPEPVPPLPGYHGQMDLGDGPTVILNAAGSNQHQGVRVGEEIGPFKLVEANPREVAFEWKGQVIRKSVDDLLDHTVPAAQATPERTANTAPPPPRTPTPIGPGQDTGRGYKSCDPNDSYAEGAVVDGYRKKVIPSPFGKMCTWDPVGR